MTGYTQDTRFAPRESERAFELRRTELSLRALKQDLRNLSEVLDVTPFLREVDVAKSDA